MASPETLNIDAINAAWAGASGAATDIDEAVASADGNLYGPGAEADAADFGFANTGEIVDGDTVTNVSITVRLKKGGTAGNEQADVQLMVSGSPVGSAVSTGNLTTSFADYGPLNDAGWNSDLSQVEVDSIEVRVTPMQSGMPGTNAVDIDCCDVIITFTSAVTRTFALTSVSPSATAAAVAAARPFIAASLSPSAVSVAFSVPVSFIAASSSVSAVATAITRATNLIASSLSPSSVNAAMTLTKVFALSSTSVSAASVALAVTRALAASSLSDSAVAVAFTITTGGVTRTFIAVSASTSEAAVALNIARNIVAASSSESTGQAALTLTKTFALASSSASAASVALAVNRVFAASSLSSSAVAVAFTVVVAGVTRSFVLVSASVSEATAAWAITRSIVAASPNYALDFDGDIVNFGDDPAFDFGTGSFTIEYMVNTLSIADNRPLVQKGPFTGNTEFRAGIGGASGRLNALLGGPSTKAEGNLGTEGINDGSPHRLSFVFDRTANFVYGYIDGVLTSTPLDISGVTGSPDSANNLRLGFSFGTFVGVADDLRIWTVARTQPEIAANRGRRLLGTESGLVGYWPMDEGQGSIVFDKTLGGNDGAITGATWIDGFDLAAPDSSPSAVAVAPTYARGFAAASLSSSAVAASIVKNLTFTAASLSVSAVAAMLVANRPLSASSISESAMAASISGFWFEGPGVSGSWEEESSVSGSWTPDDPISGSWEEEDAP